jgi:uncharacterized protein YqeY
MPVILPLVTSSTPASPLLSRLRADLTASMKARDQLRTATIRMALAAVQVESVSGKESRELSDADVTRVLSREVKKRAEAAEAFAGAGRADSAEQEKAESAVLEEYLPSQLSDVEISELVTRVLSGLDLPEGPKATGPAMKAVQAEVAGRADGGRVAAEVRRQLGG